MVLQGLVSDADLGTSAQWPKDFGWRNMPYGFNLVSHSSCPSACWVNESPDGANLSRIQ